ncbi:MAG: hypothetical protein GX758_02780 [Tenericutes bacterium]|nr:hypothetical protein [Mycoplasmatota bacterium]
MKKLLLCIISINLLIIFVKYYTSNYEINYQVDGYDITTKYDDKMYYFEISKNETYNFDIYQNRNIQKLLINKIVEISDEETKCIYPIINNVETYPLCIKDGKYIDYNLIDSVLLEDYKTNKVNTEKNTNDFVYYNNLDNKTYVALWTYKGFVIMNGNSYKRVELFNKDRYDNSLAYMIKDTIYIPNYNEEHEYSKIVTFNITNNKKREIDLGYKIDYDSYIVGNIKKKLYIFDNKYSKLYEINLKTSTTKIIGDIERGFVKYEDGDFVTCSKTEYKVNKIKYNIESSLYKYETNNGVFKTIKRNANITTKIVNSEVDIIKEYNNNIYYVHEDYLYRYDPFLGSDKIFFNYELAFNKNNTIFIYTK